MAAIKQATPAALAHYQQARLYLKQQGLDKCLKVYVSWDSRKQAIRLKLWGVPQANRGKLSELGFKFVSPLYVPKEWSAIVYINDLGVVMPAEGEGRNRKLASKVVIKVVELVKANGVVVSRYTGRGATAQAAVADAVSGIPSSAILDCLANDGSLRAF